MRQRGFTLLEMVIGMVLLGFVLVLAYGGLRLGARAWDAGENSVTVAARQAAVAGFLRRQLGQIYPLRWKLDDGRGKLAFSGEAGKLYFSAPLSAHFGPGGIHLFVLETQGEGEDAVLRLRWRTPDSEIREFEFSEDDESAVLLKGVESVEFAYFGSETKEADPAWLDAWRSGGMLPQLIRLRIKPRNAEPWPDLLIHLNLDSGESCRWDDFQERCL